MHNLSKSTAAAAPNSAELELAAVAEGDRPCTFPTQTNDSSCCKEAPRNDTEVQNDQAIQVGSVH